MRIHCLQHEHFEGMACIGRWAAERDYPITHTLFFGEGTLPEHADYDYLLVMGGSMGAYDEDKYSWLKREKKFIAEAIALGKTVLGICLGSQLLAEVIGGRVYKGPVREIGWLPVHSTPDALQSEIFKMFPETFHPLQWHGDTFELPPPAKRLAFSSAYQNQAFEYGDKVVGLQFHLELAFEDIKRFLRYQRYNKQYGPFEQSKEQILSKRENFESNERLLYQILDALAARSNGNGNRNGAHNGKRPSRTLRPVLKAAGEQGARRAA